MNGLLRALLLWLSRRTAVGDALESARPAQRVIRRFVAGTTDEEAVQAGLSLAEDGYDLIFSLLGEEVHDELAAAAAVAEYRALLERIAGAGLASASKIAVKPTLLGLGLSEQTAAGNLTTVLEAARWVGVGVELDMERSERVDQTLTLYRAAAADTPDLGIAIQAYLRRSRDDVRALIDEGIARVRLVKGAYDEPAAVALQRPAEVDSAYHQIMRDLLDADAIASGARLALATHDLRLIASARTRTYRKQVPDAAWEVQMLYGVRPSEQARLLAEGYRVRVYLPYGRHWYPYYLRRLAERPANLGFALRALVGR